MLKIIGGYFVVCGIFLLGFLCAALFAAGKIRHLEGQIRALHLLRDDENKAWLATLVRSVGAHKKYQSQDGGVS